MQHSLPNFQVTFSLLLPSLLLKLLNIFNLLNVEELAKAQIYLK